MKILVTGAGRFIGRHMVSALQDRKGITVYQCFHETDKEELDAYLSRCDFLYHLAGVNRSEQMEDFTTGNTLFTKELVRGLISHKNKCPILYASSIHAVLETPYGRSKREAEEILKTYENMGGRVNIYRLPNLFGKGAKPNYNSVVATFCYNLVRGMPIVVHDRSTVLNLSYIDDVVKEFVGAIEGEGRKEADGYYTIPKSFRVSLGEIADTLYTFVKQEVGQDELTEFQRDLYETFISYKLEAQS